MSLACSPARSMPGSTCPRPGREGVRAIRQTVAWPRRAGQGPQDRAAAGQAGQEERGHRRADGGERPGKKRMGNSERTLGSPRHARRDRRLRPPLDRPRRDCPPKRLLAWLGLGHEQVPRLERALRQGQRAQRPGASRLLARGLGESGHPRLPRPPSAGGLPPADVHDAR